MKLTIVIVNYNVRYFLEQTLRSVFQSDTNFDFIVYVVDNDSSDDSVAMVRKKFPQVRLIANTDNVGFSAANNQVLSQLETPHALLLNPDTIVSEDTLQVCMDAMEERPEVGGLGVRMIDGAGNFLPESKRGLPTPFVAFCKAFGLSRIFPGSRTFNYYHLGHIGQHDVSHVDVLSGAFMWLRKAVLDEVGLLDDTFFMYGEDIDLSYRIQKAGYKNLYLPTTSIVHFKGESTKKGSLNYVRIFYKAMIIFAQKHFVGKGAFIMFFLYKMAVVLRAGISLVGGLVRRWSPIVLDAAVIMIGLRLITWLWARVYFQDPDYFSSVPYVWHHSLYTTFWISTMYLGGAYDHYFSNKKLRKALIVATVFLFVCFSMMPSSWRPSRAVLLLGSIWTMLVLSTLRRVIGHWRGVYRDQIRVAIVGSTQEIDRAVKLMTDSRLHYEKAYRVAVDASTTDGEFVGQLKDLEEIAEAYLIDEVIFCARDVEHSRIIHWMTTLSNRKMVRIIPEEGASVIASRYKNTRGELYAIDASMNVNQIEFRRQKRVFDVIMSIVFALLSPVLVFMSNGRELLKHILPVLTGRMTWFGYRQNEFSEDLPTLKVPVIDIGRTEEDAGMQTKIYYLYARDYHVWSDVNAIYNFIFDE